MDRGVLPLKLAATVLLASATGAWLVPTVNVTVSEALPPWPSLTV